MQEIKLSVIIPTRNRCDLLKGTLESIAKQSFPKEEFEVIVNDNGSTDDTKQVVGSFYNILPNLVYHYDAKPGLHVGRHNGYKLAKSDILVYADDDIEAFPTWLEGIWESFQDPKVMLVGGKNYPKYEFTPPFWILEKWYDMCEYGHCLSDLSLIDFGDEIKEIPAYYVYGCNFSIRKKILDETKGFHPDGMPFEHIEYRGDGETYVDRYILEHGYKTIYNPKASVFHLVTKERMTIDYFKKRAFCQGVEMSYCDLRYQSSQKNTPNVIHRILRLVKRKIKDYLLFEIINNQKKSNIDIEIEKSRKIGYNYHQTCYAQSKELRSWVHKDHYLS